MDEKQISKEVKDELLSEYIEKLDQINFTEYDKFELRSNDWMVNIEFDFYDNVINPLTSVLVTLNVYYHGTLSATLTCETEEQINKLRVWFIQTRGQIQEDEDLNESDYEVLARNAFKNLL